ncbi:HORMA domain-containing protein 1 [Centroberyx affinis]|uniref:HORMA domain-containing protein 1 n=1 Tax=Centroberyx affinis TaxID=166261 RepID=UPI003A5BB504
MACVQRLRTAQTQLLPNTVATEQQSLVVVKKLLAIAVSSITYLRGLFPEKAYGSKYVEEQKVMILREERSCPGANQIVQWMQGCFDAIQRKYLRTVILSIYTDPENPQKVTEFYQFKIQYTAKGPQMDFESSNNNKVSTMTCSNTKKASILLVRKLYTLMQNLGPLPDNVCLNMKLSYYDDVTPQDYQPPGFKEGDSDIMEFEKEPVKLAMGEVVTPFHTLKVDMTTEKDRLEQVEEEPVHSRDKWALQMEEEAAVSQSHVIEDVEKPHNENSYLDDTEVQMSCREKMEVCEEVTVNSQMDTLVKRTSDMEVALKRTRSGRVIRSAMEKKSTKISKKPSPTQDKTMSQFEFPSSQEVPSSSAPKRRKFSEPKERY